MISSPEQVFHSDFIKNVHRQLRIDTETLGMEKAWQKHCNNKKILDQYAHTMESLAVNYWDKSCVTNEKSTSRIQWIYESSIRYFKEIDKYRNKELKYVPLQTKNEFKSILTGENKSWQLLDVGSCYNPFRKFNLFQVTSIDIAPADDEVYLCDFLNVKISDQFLIENKSIVEFSKESFHVVVFSLFLEYFPDPKLRLMCCEKAYKLLYPEGILVIATPDSNHIGSNAKIFKSWKHVLCKIGFSRVQYEKLPHLHCMVFRKSITKEAAQHLLNIYEKNYKYYDQIYIPQDFKNSKNCESNANGSDCLNELKWSSDTFLDNFVIVDDLFK